MGWYAFPMNSKMNFICYFIKRMNSIKQSVVGGGAGIVRLAGE